MPAPRQRAIAYQKEVGANADQAFNCYGVGSMRNSRGAGIRAAIVLAATALFSAQVYADTAQRGGYDRQDFRLTRAGELVDVCTVGENHPDYRMAMAFCYGFFEGGIHYDRALAVSPDHERIVCEPNSTTRTQVVEVFVAYMKANPKYGEEMPIDAIFRALIDKWPCT